MKFNSVIIITYGRSGSTLLMGILNSIDGYLIRGENDNFFFHLFKAYMSIKKTKNFPGTQSINPWYGSDFIDENKFLMDASIMAKNLIVADKINDNSIRCYGFKEIRYYLPHVQKYFNEYLKFLTKIFPNCCFVFNKRNIDDVMKSGWWHRCSEKEKKQNRELLLKLENKFENYCNNNSNSFKISYEELVSKDLRLRQLFDFLGENYDKDKVEQILNTKHSTESVNKKKYSQVIN